MWDTKSQKLHNPDLEWRSRAERLFAYKQTLNRFMVIWFILGLSVSALPSTLHNLRSGSSLLASTSSTFQVQPPLRCFCGFSLAPWMFVKSDE